MDKNSVDLSDSLWAKIIDSGCEHLTEDQQRDPRERHFFKTHVCPTQLVADLISDLTTRNPSAKLKVTPVNGIMLDLPGMMWSQRGYQEIKIDTLNVSMPYNDFAALYARYKMYEQREFSSGSKYFKFHNRFVCLVLTPDQRDYFMQTMHMFVDRCEIFAELECLAATLKNVDDKKNA